MPRDYILNYCVSVQHHDIVVGAKDSVLPILQ